jgi:hypothetical protein
MLVIITSENAKPTIVAPLLLKGYENVPLALADIFVGDIDVQLKPGNELIF